MDRATTPLDNLHALELRVLDGPQRDARAPLATGTSWVLAAEPRAHSIGADIVLHEEGPATARVRVTAETSHALIEVLSGQVQLGEQWYGAGAQALWPRQTALHIGSSVVAYGLACVDRWGAEATATATATPSPDPAPPGAATTAPPGTTAARTTQPGTTPLRRRAEVWLAATGAGLLVACLGSLWMARVIAAPHSEPAAPATLAAALKSTAFAGLEVATQADGRAKLRGRLATLADRARLEAWLAARQFTASIDVAVDEAITRDVTEVFRVNGIAVQAHMAGPGQVEAEAAERDADRLARTEDVVRRDVRGVDQLRVHNTATPLPPPAPVVPDDPGKRIASLVQGDPAYVVTVDGARYFVGAILPSGHRITAVAQQSVLLERDGHQSTLNF